MENFTQTKLRIITWEQLLTKLWGLFHPLEVKAQLYKFLRQKSESVSCSIMSDSFVTPQPTSQEPASSSVHGILQSRILEWVVIPFSSLSSWPRDQTQVYLHCRQILYHLSQHRCTLIMYYWWVTQSKCQGGWWVRVAPYIKKEGYLLRSCLGVRRMLLFMVEQVKACNSDWDLNLWSSNWDHTPGVRI